MRSGRQTVFDSLGRGYNNHHSRLPWRAVDIRHSIDKSAHGGNLMDHTRRGHVARH